MTTLLQQMPPTAPVGDSDREAPQPRLSRLRRLAQRDKRFCQLFASSFATLLVGAAALNYVVNPLAQYQSRWLRPVVKPSRLEKIQLFDACDPAPEGLILGSSRVLKFEPSYLELKTGCRFYNAGVNYATSHDHLALLRYYQQRHDRLPKIVLLGLDLSSFSEKVLPDARTLSIDHLAGLVPDAYFLSDRARRWTDLLSWHQTRQSLHSLKHHWFGGMPPSNENYQRDGFLVYVQRERQIANGVYDFGHAFASTKREYEARLRTFGGLSCHRMKLFEQFVAATRDQGTRLIVFLTTMHPDLVGYLSARTPFSERQTELLGYLNSQAESQGFAVLDFTDVATYQGDPDEFVDGIHPLETNTRRMIDMALHADPVPR